MIKRLLAIFDALSKVAPDLFQIEVAAGLGYAVVLFNLHIADTYRAALLGAAVFVFTLLQAAYRATQKPAA